MINVSQKTNLYQFPEIDEFSLIQYRLRSFAVGVLIAVLPFLINSYWRLYDQSSGWTLFFKSSIPDLAFAGVAISITTFTNTKESFVKLIGYKITGNTTFVLLFVNTIAATICFVSYMRSTHTSIDETQVQNLFLFSAIFALSTLISGFVAQLSFAKDEMRQSREFIQTLPISYRSGGRS